MLLNFFNAVKARESVNHTREAKAESVRQKANSIAQAFKSMKGDDFISYYLHAAVAHLPTQILECPVDVFDASGCAIEHLHKGVKHSFL